MRERGGGGTTATVISPSKQGGRKSENEEVTRWGPIESIDRITIIVDLAFFGTNIDGAGGLCRRRASDEIIEAFLVNRFINRWRWKYRHVVLFSKNCEQGPSRLLMALWTLKNAKLIESCWIFTTALITFIQSVRWLNQEARSIGDCNWIAQSSYVPSRPKRHWEIRLLLSPSLIIFYKHNQLNYSIVFL